MSCARVSKSSGMQMVLLHQICRTEKDEAPVQILGHNLESHMLILWPDIARICLLRHSTLT